MHVEGGRGLFQRERENRSQIGVPGELARWGGNGRCYRHWRFQKLLRCENMRQRFTWPSTPRTNGKAERFIQTALREWAYGRTYQNSAERTEQLELWPHDYNFHRPHSSLGLKFPTCRPGFNRNNLLIVMMP